MSDPIEPYFVADFGENGGRFEWSSREEIAGWIGQLQNRWEWIGQQRHSPTNNALQVIVGKFNATQQALTHASNHRKQGQTQQAESQLASARSSLEDFVRTYPWILPDSAQCRFVEGLRDAGQKLEAALIVAHWLAQDLNGAPIRQTVNALLTWELHDRGIKDRMKSESAALKRLAGDMQTALTQHRELERQQVARFDDLYKQDSDQSLEHHGVFVEGEAKRNSLWQEQLTGMQNELKSLKETYDKHMALAAPVEYWDTKRRRHKSLAIVSFFAVIVCMALGGFLLHTELQTVANAALEAKTAASSGTSAEAAKANSTATLLQSQAAWQFGSFLLLATLSFWFTRLIVRIFLSNLHLENDASERVTMAKTYLALLRDGGMPKGDSINTVLAALFRPTGDGIVKDEGLPPSAMEWITKLGAK
ncbi:MAG: DUF6161 domain-containing protein [Sulfuritalea sp.]|nr:DUF6161 domain-containing protein [Sulfuritalea sp.]